MKGILLLIFVAILLGLSSFQSQSAQQNIIDSDKGELKELAQNILSPESEIGQQINDEVKSELEILGISKYESLDNNYRITVDRKCLDYNPYILSKYDEFIRALKEQIIEAANYIAFIHTTTLGKQYSIFTIKNIKICSNQYPSAFLTYDNLGTLHINNLLAFKKTLVLKSRQSDFSSNPYLSMGDIQTLWDKGVIFSKGDNQYNQTTLLEKLSNKKLNTVWKLINPYGVFRINLRKAIHEHRTKLIDLFKNSADPIKNLQDISSEKLPNELQPLLKTILKDQNLQENLYQSYMDLLQDDHFFYDIASAKTKSLQDVLVAKSKDKNKNSLLIQIGFVNVGNDHDIEVKVNLYEEFKELLNVNDKITIDRKVVQIGAVNVFTIDDIDVSLMASTLIDFEELKTLVLGKALKRIKSTISNQ